MGGPIGTDNNANDVNTSRSIDLLHYHRRIPDQNYASHFCWERVSGRVRHSIRSINAFTEADRINVRSRSRTMAASYVTADYTVQRMAAPGFRSLREVALVSEYVGVDEAL